MKQQSRMIALILSAAMGSMLLTACDSAVSTADSGTSSAVTSAAPKEEQSAPDSAPAENSAAEQPADSTAPADSAADSSHAAEQTSVQTTAAQTTESQPQQTEPNELPNGAFDCRPQFENGSRISPITGKGWVFARSGLNLREKPSASSKKLTTIPFDTMIDVTALTFTGELSDDEARWLKVKTGGKEGYVSANYVAVSCSKKGGEMNDEERAALGMLMYYQSRRILEYYIFDGALRATGVDLKNMTEDYWAKLSPKGLTLQKIMDDFGRYFSMDYPYDPMRLYREENGWLYMQVETPENPYLDYDELTYLTKKTDTKLTYRAVGHWFTEGEFVMYTENGGIQNESFVIEYVDGVWKTAKYTPIR